MAGFVPTGQQVKNLALLCQVWGFVKYHLPKVAAGDVNMDAELFRVMPAVIKAQNYSEASEAIEQWVDKLGAPAACAICKPFSEKDLAQKPDYGEIFDRTIVSSSLADKLTFILNNHDDGKSYREHEYYSASTPFVLWMIVVHFVSLSIAWVSLIVMPIASAISSWRYNGCFG